MTTEATPSNTPAAASVISAEKLSDILGCMPRWRMLGELSKGEPRTIAELADAGGCSYGSAIKHLQYMRGLGVVAQGRGKVYQLPAQFQPTPGAPLIDFGHCVLRFNVGK